MLFPAKRKQFSNHQEAVLVVLGGKVSHTRFLRVSDRSAEVFLGHLFVSDRFDHIGPGDKHVAGVFHHENKIGEAWRINGSAGTGPHDGADLWHHPRQLRVLQRMSA